MSSEMSAADSSVENVAIDLKDQLNLTPDKLASMISPLEDKSGGTPCPAENSSKLIIVMVGLPARGKSYIGRRITRYLNWLKIPTKIFNVGMYRRNLLGSHQSHNFFDTTNKEAYNARWQLAVMACDDLIRWLNDGGQVAIYDATNTVRERRSYLINRFIKELGIARNRVVFLESICNDKLVVNKNIRQTKLDMPDYAGVDPDQAVRDFTARIRHYEDIYEPLDEIVDEKVSYIKLIDVGRKIIMNRINGFLPGRISFLMMNIHIHPRTIFLTRHGESIYNTQGKIGGDSDLSSQGEAYGHVLSEFIEESLPEEERKTLTVWTSTLQRTIRTAQLLQYRTIQWKALDEIDAGICDGMTYEQIQKEMPEEYAARAKDKFMYRYPRGESYYDMIQRLDPVTVELERQKAPILIIAHQAVCRALYAYLVGCEPEECTGIPIPLHEVIQITPNAYGFKEARHNLSDRVATAFAALKQSGSQH